MTRHVTSLLVLLVTTSFAHAGAAHAGAGSPPPVSFTADPAAGSSTSAAGGWFVLRAAPGSSARQALTLRNTSTRPVELVIAPVDAVTSALGGASYGLPQDKVTRAGSWVVPVERRVALKPGEARDVPFTVDVPRGAQPGDHLAGLSVAAPSDVSTTVASPRQGPATSLDLRTRRVIAVQVDVPGPAEPRIDITAVTSAVKPTGAQLEIALTNAGRRLTRGRGVLTLTATGRRIEFGLDTFVPGTSIAYPLAWPDGVGRGKHEARVELSYAGRTARWSGVLDVDSEQANAVVRDKAAAAAGANAAPPTSGPPTALLAVAVAGGIGVALVGQGAVRRLRRRVATTPPDDAATA